MNILFLILSTQKYKKSRQISQKNTWLKGQKFLFVSDEDSEDSKKFSDNKEYSSCEEKQLNCLYWLTEKNSYDWYFFCDDDTYVNCKNLEAFINLFDGESFGKQLTQLSDPRNPMWAIHGKDFCYYSGGAGFGLSNKAIAKIKKHIFPKTYYADVSIGKVISANEIKMFDCSLLNMNKPTHFNHSPDQIRKSISYHYISPDEMIKLQNLSNA